MKNVFNKTDAAEIVTRINKLQADTQPLWGKMAVAQMLAHCCVTYEMVFEDKHPKPNVLMKFVLKKLVKNSVVNEVPYKHDGKTAPQFIISDTKNFAFEKERLINFLTKTQEAGEAFFDGKESHSFGVLNKTEWNNMFYKHLDHHLRQFGV